MTPPTSVQRVLELPHSWPGESQVHGKQEEKNETEGRQMSKPNHREQRDIWDQLAGVDKSRRQKNAEDVIEYLEDRLSQLTEEGSDDQAEELSHHQDIFSQRHRSVIEDAAGEDR